MIDLFSITVVLARFFALYMFVNATFSIPAALTLIKQQREMGFGFGSDSIILIITALAYVTVALLLFTLAKKFASYVTRGLENRNLHVSEGHYNLLQAVAFSILGAYILTYAIPNLVKIITLYILSDPSQDDVAQPQRVPIEYLIEASTQFVLGVWLFVGSKGITKVVSKGWDGIKAE